MKAPNNTIDYLTVSNNSLSSITATVGGEQLSAEVDISLRLRVMEPCKRGNGRNPNLIKVSDEKS